MNQSMIMTTIVLAFIAVTGGAAYAGQEDGARKDRWARSHGSTEGVGVPGAISDRMADRLGLDESQAQSVTNVMEAARPEFEALRERGHTLKQSIREFDPANPDYGVMLQNASAESGQVAAELVLLTGRVRADIHRILTPEQRQSLADMMARLDGRRGRDSKAR